MLISLIRTLIIYVFIIFAVRIMGKRQIKELQTTELVVTLLISDIAAIPMQDNGQPLSSGLIPIFVLIACEILASVLMLKSAKFRRLICGKPIVIIDNGKIMQKEMKELRISTYDLFEELREKDIFSLSDVKYALVETNGALTVYKNPNSEPPTKSDLGIKGKDEMEIVIINDGKFSETSMELVNVTENSVKKILKKNQKKLEDIFIMTYTHGGKYRIIEKEIK